MEQEHEGPTLTTEPELPDESQDGVTAAAEEALSRVSSPPVGSMPGRGISERAQAAAADAGDDVRSAEDEDRESMRRVGRGKPDLDDIQAATDWLLSDTTQVNTKKLEIRVGGSDENPVYVGWVIRAIDVNVIRAAEREAMGNRASRRAAADTGYDELKANLRVVAEGTVEPDVKALAQGQGMRDPTSLLRRRFSFRSGVLASIAAEIMALSGFDADDVRAAGNS